MTNRATLEALLARVLEGEGPDRELDFAIAAAFGWPDSPNLHQHARRYTESLDAALTLVPEGWHWSVSGTVNMEYHARIVPPAGSLKTFVGHWREAKSAPRALIAVCLKARMATQGE